MSERPVQYAPVQLPESLIEGTCRDYDVSVFFPGRGDMTGIARAVAICRGCSVREECLDFALQSDERFGIWGGMTGKQRRKEKRLRRLTSSSATGSTDLE